MKNFEEYIEQILFKKYFFVEKDIKIIAFEKNNKNHLDFKNNLIEDLKYFKDKLLSNSEIEIYNENKIIDIIDIKKEFLNFYEKKLITNDNLKLLENDLYNYIKYDKRIFIITKLNFKNKENKFKLANQISFYKDILEDLKPIASEYSDNIEEFYEIYLKRRKATLKENLNIIYIFLNKEFKNNVEKIENILNLNPSLEILFKKNIEFNGVKQINYDIQLEILNKEFKKYFYYFNKNQLNFLIDSFTKEWAVIMNYEIKIYKNNDDILINCKYKNNSKPFNKEEYKNLLFDFLKSFKYEEKNYFDKNGIIKENIKAFIYKNILDYNMKITLKNKKTIKI